MAMWRDPLDELIDALEQRLPPAPEPAKIDDQASLIGCHLWTSAVLYGTGDVARVEQDPRVKAFFAQLEASGPVSSRGKAQSNPKEDPREPNPQ